MSSPILKPPNYNKPFFLYCDASQTGIGSCLLQEYNNILHPISYISKGLNPAQRNYSATKLEALSLISVSYTHLTLPTILLV